MGWIQMYGSIFKPFDMFETLSLVSVVSDLPPYAKGVINVDQEGVGYCP